MKRMRISKAQSVSEYSICVAIIILAIVVMQVYVKRGLQGRYADVVDFATSKMKTPQYEPYYQREELGSRQDMVGRQIIGPGGAVNRVITQDLVTRSGETKELITDDD